jgi:DNA-binding NarL/FixJ family response regulator
MAATLTRGPLRRHEMTCHAKAASDIRNANADVVASILSAHTEGTAVNRIASDLGIHHKTVSKIIDAAENHRRHLVAV